MHNAFSGYGLTLAPASSVQGPGSRGVAVSDIDPDGVAAQKGLQIGDVILEAGGHAVNKPADISAVLAEAKKDNRKAVLLRVKGSEGTHFVAIKVMQGDLGKSGTESPVVKALGMGLSSLNYYTRKQFAINSTVASGMP